MRKFNDGTEVKTIKRKNVSCNIHRS